MKDQKTNHPNRRQFLSSTLKTGALLPLMTAPLLSIGDQSIPQKLHTDSPKPLKILILGGTSFLGPHQIAYALGRGHSISIFTRGKTKPTIHQELFKKVEHLVGDRVDNLEALKGRKWDAVIDNSGRRVKWTEDTANLLKDNVGLYLYVSSTGVYYPYFTSDIKETQKLALEVPEDATEGEKGEYNYGVMKALSEQAAQKIFGKDRAILVRPSYMLGPADRTPRSAYWPERMAQGGEILIPGKGDEQVQYIDVRDMAGFMIRLIENKTAGAFNGVGPISKTSLHQFIYGVHAVFSSNASFVMAEDIEFLKDQNVTYQIPWVMPTDDHLGTTRINNDHSISNGLTFRPLAETVKDIYEWWHSAAVSEERREKLVSGERSLMVREKEVIAAWKARK